MNKILITGGDGYIGKNLIDYLKSEQGCICEVVDEKSGRSVLGVQAIWKFDGIVHLAAMSGITQCKNHPEKAVENNVSSTFHIMRLAKKYDIPLVFASSGAASTPLEHLYGMTKWLGECEAKRLNIQGANNHILRFSNVYGGYYWENKTSAVPLFLKAFNNGQKLIVNGDGSQKRDFIHVWDICRAIWLALTAYKNVNLPIPICTGVMTSILELAERIAGPNGYEMNASSDKVGVKSVKSNTDLAYFTYNFRAKERLEDHL